jgi:hypothetical protein
MKKYLSFLQNLTLLLKTNIAKVKHYKSISKVPYKCNHDDIYLVSYPRSGSTWLSFLIANAGIRYFKVSQDVNFFNIHHLVPDIESGQDIKTNIYPFNSRIIKSHSFFNPFYKSVFYLVRHPDQVMFSYFKFLTGLGQFNGNISEFIRSKNFGICSWVRHVQGWLSYNNPALGIVVLRYEDLVQDSSKEIIKLFKYIGYSLSNADAEFASLKTSLSTMKTIEEELVNDGRLIAPNHKHIRGGGLKDSNDALSEIDKQFIRNSAKEIMNKFDYL